MECNLIIKEGIQSYITLNIIIDFKEDDPEYEYQVGFVEFAFDNDVDIYDIIKMLDVSKDAIDATIKNINETIKEAELKE